MKQNHDCKEEAQKCLEDIRSKTGDFNLLHSALCEHLVFGRISYEDIGTSWKELKGLHDEYYVEKEM